MIDIKGKKIRLQVVAVKVNRLAHPALMSLSVEYLTSHNMWRNDVLKPSAPLVRKMATSVVWDVEVVVYLPGQLSRLSPPQLGGIRR